LSKYLTIPIGLILGIFIGLLSSALAEVLNVIPVLSKKLKIKDNLKYIVWTLMLGKVAGSLYFWIFTK
jgi:stage V sporulation protein AB